MRLKLFALVVLIAVGAAAYVALRPIVLPQETEEPCVGEACGEDAIPAEQELARRYAPILYLNDRVTDCGLPAVFRPLPVEVLFDNPQIVLRKQGSFDAKVAPTVADLYNAPEESFLDFPGNPRRPGCRYVRDGDALSAGQPSVAYARIATEEDFPELVLQYWFFYYFNQWNNKHEGDWEMIQIVFEATSATEALEIGPHRVAYSQHNNGELALWEDKKLSKEGDRPVVRVSAGANANWYTPHIFIGRGEHGFGCDDATGSIRVDPEVRLLPSGPIGPDDPFAWLTFRGRWGELAGPEFDGPTGPNMKTQWDSPLTWENRLRTGSVRLPERETIGPNAIEFFCDVVAWGSNIILPIYLQLPQITIAAVGLLALGMVVSLTRTRYVPAHSEPLRARRRFGQILVAAAHVYLVNARLFIGISLVFLPVALIVSVLHWLVFNVSPIDPIVPLPRADVARDVILAFALSELQFGIAYAIVMVACTAALAALEQGRETGVRLAYKEGWQRLRDWLPPRLFAIAAVAAATLTVVGIPFAVRQAVRWTFVEPAVLMDGAGPREGLSRSSAAVDGSWWWAAGAAFFLGLIGLFLAPVVGVILILLVPSIPLADVNLITSAIHVALVPFVAIAYSLIYFELRGRAGAAGKAAGGQPGASGTER